MPNIGQKLSTCAGSPATHHQKLEESKLSCGEFDTPAIVKDSMLHAVQCHAAEAHHGIGEAATTSQQGTAARHQFMKAERLKHKVIRAQVQAADAFF